MHKILNFGKINQYLVIIIAALCAGIGFFTAQYFANKPSDSPILLAAKLYPTPKPLLDFSLQRQRQDTFSLNNLRGQWSIIFFGFTHCPDVCPNTLQLLNGVHKKLATTTIAIPQFIFISVDPNRDTPEQLEQYVKFFNKDFIGTSGTTEQLDQLTKQLGVIYYQQQTETSYTIDHTAALMLINPDAQLHAIFTTPHHVDNISQDYQSIVNHYKY